MKTLKELDEMRYAYRKKAKLQKYENINSQMAFRNKLYKGASVASPYARGSCQLSPHGIIQNQNKLSGNWQLHSPTVMRLYEVYF